MPRNALGKGLSALIPEPELPQQPPAGPAAATPSAAGAAAPAKIQPQAEGLLHADIDLIDPSPYQPRSRFREESLEELARSIRVSGIVQPLVVRRIGNRFQLIAGERRWRAAQRAGLRHMPVVVRELDDLAAIEIAIIENVQG